MEQIIVMVSHIESLCTAIVMMCIVSVICLVLIVGNSFFKK